MPQSVVSPHTCSSPTSNVRTSDRRTQELPLVRHSSLQSVGRTKDIINDNWFHTGQVGKVLGERWKALSQKQRDPYEAKAAADKKRYEDEKAAYQANSGNGEDDDEDD